MTAGRRDLQGAASQRLTRDIAQIEGRRISDGGGVVIGEAVRALVFRARGSKKTGGAADCDAGHEGSLAQVRAGNDCPPEAPGAGLDDDGQDAGNRAEAAVQGQLSKEQTVTWFGKGFAGGSEERHRDCEVKSAPGFPHMGGGQIDGDPSVPRELQGRVPQRSLDPAFTLSHRRVGKPHDEQAWEAGRRINFHANDLALDSGDGSGMCIRKHGSLRWSKCPVGERADAQEGRLRPEVWVVEGPNRVLRSPGEDDYERYSGELWFEAEATRRTCPMDSRDELKPFKALIASTVVLCRAATEDRVSPF